VRLVIICLTIKGHGEAEKATVGNAHSKYDINAQGSLPRPGYQVRIPFLKSYKYLGISLTVDFRMSYHLDYLKPKINYV